MQREKQEKLEKSALIKMDQQMQRLCQENELLQQENGRLSQIYIAMDENSKGNLQTPQKLGFDNASLNSNQQVYK